MNESAWAGAAGSVARSKVNLTASAVTGVGNVKLDDCVLILGVGIKKCSFANNWNFDCALKTSSGSQF